MTNIQRTFVNHALSATLLDELSKALKNVRPFGSVEIIVQNDKITQITARNIKKTDGIELNQL